MYFGCGQKCVQPFRSQNSKIDCTSKMKGWNELIFLHAGANLGKLKVILLIFEWVWSKMDVAI